MDTDSTPGPPRPGVGPVDAEFGDDHFFRRLPLTNVFADAQRAVVDLDNTPDLQNSHGALQGGIVATLTDIAAGRAATNQVGNYGLVTSDLSLHFLRPIRVGPARATATVVHHGARTVLVSVDVVDVGDERLAARATVRFAVISAGSTPAARLDGGSTHR